MDKTLRFWVDCSYEDRRYENPKRTRTQLIAEILREYEQCGDAMRYLNAKGQMRGERLRSCFRGWPTPNARFGTTWRIVREGSDDIDASKPPAPLS
jgi:hypothetical protein